MEAFAESAGGPRQGAADATPASRLRFGLSLVPDARDPRSLRAIARAADAAGLDLLGVQDHPYVPGHLETWTLLSVLAAETERIALFPNVASLPLRQPAVLAKSAATLDLLSGGRVELGLGSGAFRDGIAALGGPSLAPGEAVAALEEGIAVVRAMWRAGEATVPGRRHALRGARGGPAPAHAIGIWVGAVGPRMLRLTGRLADGWAAPLPKYLPVERLAQAQATIDAAARAAGRDPARVARVLNHPTDLGAPGGSSSRALARLLAGRAVELGFDALVLWPQAPSPELARRIAEDVAPAVRDAVRAERGGASAVAPG